MFLTSKRRREGGDRPHTAADRCREVSPRGIYERHYKFAAAANPINYCSKVLALPPLLVIYNIYIYKRAIMFSPLSEATIIYIYAASPSQLYSNPKLVGQAWVSELSPDPCIYDLWFFFIRSQPLQSFPFYHFFFLSTTIT